MRKILNKEFINKLEQIYSNDDLKIIEEWFSINKRKTVVRVNTLKNENEKIEIVLKENKISFKKGF